MIQDVDEALKALVRRDALNGSGAEVVFDAPTKDWAVRRNSPTVDLYLYDIREDLARRSVGREEVRDQTGRITGRKPPGRYFKLSYLLTAWTQRPEDEHRLLAALLACFLTSDRVDPSLLGGALDGLEEPITLTIAHPPPEDRSSSDVWSALGGELKPSLDLVVSVPVELGRLAATAPLVTELPRFQFGDDETDEEVSARRAAARARAGTAGDITSATPAIAEEEVRAGDPDAKDGDGGRIFKIRSFPRP